MSSSPEHPRPLRAVVEATRDWVERLGWVWVEGQLIEIKRRATGLQFLTLRDTTAEVSVSVSAPAHVLDAAGPLTEGTEVAAWVHPSVWPNSGRLTFECREIRPFGEGRLLAQIEQRKRMLQAEGLFEPSLKQPLPFLPRTIGLITAAGSAAEQDVLTNVLRRWPAARFEIRHPLMQGPQCAQQVMDALKDLASRTEIDVIVIARGGGSLEDLLPFSDESLVRAVFACRKPVVSAIGHETDNPILDLVADLRASTPTDAAKRIVPDAHDEGLRVTQALGRIRHALNTRLTTELTRLTDVRSRPVLRDPGGSLAGHVALVTDLTERLRRAAATPVRDESVRVEHLITRIRAMSPQATLQRGYAILVDPLGRTVTSVAQTSPGSSLAARLIDGELDLTVRAIATQEQP